MSNPLLLIIQNDISMFINADMTPPLCEMTRLKEVTKEALQLLNEIEKLNEFPPLKRLETVIRELVGYQKKKLISNLRFVDLFSLLIERLLDHYYITAGR